MKKKIIITASVFGALAVVAGAFGAHGLDGTISAKNLAVWHTAVEYQFYHVLALVFLSTLTRFRTRMINYCYYFFSAGILLFSGSLYLLSCNDLLHWDWVVVMGPVTPIGGVLLIVGWATLGFAALKNRFK